MMNYELMIWSSQCSEVDLSWTCRCGTHPLCSHCFLRYHPLIKTCKNRKSTAADSRRATPDTQGSTWKSCSSLVPASCLIYVDGWTSFSQVIVFRAPSWRPLDPLTPHIPDSVRTMTWRLALRAASVSSGWAKLQLSAAWLGSWRGRRELNVK